MKALVQSAILASLASFHIASAQAATTYQFTATALSGGGEIAGTFDYDPTAAPVANDGGVAGTFYPGAVTNLQGSWDGQYFSDAAGYVGVWNDSLVDVGLDNVDLVQLTADGPSGGDLVGFEKVIGGVTYTLTNVRILWIEDDIGNTGPIVDDFMDDELLPLMLPPTSDMYAARLALDFVALNNPANTRYEFGFGLQVTPVPLPASVWLMAMSLGGLFVAKRRKA